MADQNVIEVMVTKAKRVLEVNLKELPDAMFREAVYRGLKDILNAGQTGDGFKTLGLKDAELEKVREGCFEKAEANLKALYAGEIKTTGAPGAKASKLPKEIKDEALRLARLAVVQALKDDGEKVSLYAKSDITKWAKEAIENDPSFLTQAEAELARRKATPVKISLAGLKPSAKLVEAAEAKKKTAGRGKDNPLSAKQAAIPTRRKPGAQPTAH